MLQKGDFAAATSTFDDTMVGALPAEELRQTWNAIESQLGKLTGWRIVERSSEKGLLVRVGRMTFEKGELIGQVVVNVDKGKVSGLFFRPAPSPSAPPAASDDRFRSEEMQFGTAPWTIRGTLLLPRGAGPWPAVVLVAGSGPQDRDESVGANKPFRDLAEGLAARNIAVLRYDKRTFLHGGRMPLSTITVEEEVIADAAAAIDILRTRPEIASARIAVVGHSLGAFLAPEIAQRAAPTAVLVLLAVPGRPLPMILVDQLRFVGAPPAEIDKIERQAKLLLTGKLKPEETFVSVPVSYWTDLLKRNAIAVAKTLRCPILILRGGRDYQVTAVDQQIWSKAFEGVATVTIETLPDLNHIFIAGAGPSGPAEYERPGRVDDRAVERIARFILAERSR